MNTRKTFFSFIPARPLMLSLVLAGGFCFCSLFSFAQTNLVPNPSFEIYSQCPFSYTTPVSDQVLNATGWSSYRETPDYFHVCATFSGVKIPSNNMGYQFAHIGSAYCGGATYNKNALYREIIGSQLSSPLIIGQKYYVSFYTCLSGKSGFNFATDKIGVKLTTSPHNYLSNPIQVNNTAQVYYDTLLTDTTNWKLIFGSFIADSSYQYIAIGNFFDDFNTDTFCIDNGSLTLDGYYYIDDVCISTDSFYAATWASIPQLSPPNFSISPNPSNGMFSLVVSGSEFGEIEIHNTLGELIFSSQLQTTNYELDLRSKPPGIYFITLSTA